MANPLRKLRRWHEMASTARRISGRSRLSQAFAILYCRLAGGKLGMTEYYENNLYAAPTLSLQSQTDFLGERKEVLIHNQLNDREWRVFSSDKIVFYTFLKGLGLPFPPLYAIYHPRGRFIGDVPSFANTAALADYLRTKMTYPFFSKPSHGGYGSRSFLVQEYKRQSDTLTIANGEEVPVEKYTREIAVDSDYGHLMQQPIAPHPSAEAICGHKLASLRLNMLGLDVFRAFWCVPLGNNMVSNFGSGSSGNLLCAVNVDTGVIQRVIQGAWDERREISAHPITGHTLTGFKLPDWERAVNLATNAARALPRLLSTHWDVALTPNGPVLLEVNFKNVFRGPQIAFGRGSLDSEMRDFLANNHVANKLDSARI